MRVIIIGAGQVGRALASTLSHDHEIVVVDFNPERLERVRLESDVMTYHGNGAELGVLREADVSAAGMVIACTSDDQSNILISSTAKALNPETFAIARVAETGYLSTWSQVREAFNVDLMVGADDLTARGIAEVAGLRTARHVEFFSGGKVEMAELKIPSGSSLDGKQVQEVDISDGLNFAAVFNADGLEIVQGKTRLQADARLIVIGRPDEVQEFGQSLSPEKRNRKLSRVMILGGGEIGYQTALLMQKQKIQPKLIEWDPERANFLAENLPGTIVLQNDATDPEFLRREGVPDAELLVSCLRPDDRNLLTSLLGKQLGAEKSISVVHNTIYEPLFIDSGVDVTLNPRREVIQEILRYTREGSVKKIAFVGHHQGEVIEIELEADSLLVDRPLKESAQDFPRQMVIGAVTRGDEILIPRGDTVMKAGDNIILFVDTDALEALEKI